MNVIAHSPWFTTKGDKNLTILLEHVDHVVQVDEGVVDGNNIGPLLEGGPEDQATDTAKSVDSDGSHV